ncbi:ATP-binding protein [Paraburkholderia sp. MM5477-R1]|uniref:ATP-binding protein n=1 Tax=Paraburkholderia sp. MM5477-R1 TaxID=2991062 RepID=UPI003D1B2948
MRNVTLADNERELSSISSAIAEQTAQSLQGVELLLRRAAVLTDVERVGTSSSTSTEFLRGQMGGVPQVRELTVADASGKLIASSAAADGSAINIAARPYFQYLEHAKGDAIAISEPITSMVDGKPTFAIAIRLESDSGRFEGVAIALIEEDYFRNFYREVDLQPGTQIRLLRTNGEPIIAYLQPASAPMGKRIQSVTHLVHGFPLAIQALRNESFVLADWRAFAINVLVRTALIATVIAMLAFLLIKLLRSLQGVIEQLRSSEQRWRAVFEHAPVGVLVLHAHSNYLMANPAFERMLGYSREELARLRAIDITHPDDIEVTKSNIDDLVTGRCDSVRFQKRYLHRDGHVVWTDMSIARVFAIYGPAAQSGRPTEHMLIATAEDITQRLDDEDRRRRLEDQLRQSQKLEALGTFAGGVAHDFNNILGAILGYGERALSVLGEGTPERRYVDQMTRAGDRARLLVERILTFSRSGMTARVHVHLQPVVAEAIELLKGTLPATIKLDVRLDADDAFAMGDATHMHQIIMNLGSNAVHAMPQGGVLGVALVRVRSGAPVSFSHGAVGSRDFVRLTVKDTGIGIPADVLERIFNPFFTTRRAGEGTGLGLSLVDGIVREYGGGIDVQTAPGEGTRFDVYLPVTDAPPAPHEHGRESLPHGDGQVVLLVDDEDTLVTLGEEVLAELGYEPVGFRSSIAAWEALVTGPNRFDAVITDQTMPELTGLALAARIRTLRPGLPVILCSGFSNTTLERDAREEGVLTVLRKPLRQADIAEALARAFKPASSH